MNDPAENPDELTRRDLHDHGSDSPPSEHQGSDEEVIEARIIQAPQTGTGQGLAGGEAEFGKPADTQGGSAKARSVRITSILDKPAPTPESSDTRGPKPPVKSPEGAAGQPNPGETHHTGEVRRGSPFAPDTNRPATTLGSHQLQPPVLSSAAFDQGVSAETAGGGVVAAGVITPLALAALFWFPVGGAMIAGLGGLLGLVGISSRYGRWGISLLVVHGAIFAGACYRLI